MSNIIYDETGEPSGIQVIEEAISDGVVTPVEKEHIEQALESMKKETLKAKRASKLGAASTISLIIANAIKIILEATGTSDQIAAFIKEVLK